MSKELLQDILIGGLVVLSQTLLFRYLSLFGTYIDFVFIYLLWVMSTRSRTEALVIAFMLGFATDFFMDSWGLHMIAKTLTVFVLYNLIPRLTETKLDTWQVFLILLGVGLFHNVIFAGLSQFTEVFQVTSFLLFWLGNTVYTALFGSFIYLFKTG